MKIRSASFLVLSLATISSAQAQLRAVSVAGGLTQPTGYYANPSVAGEAYVTQKTGQVVRIQGGTQSTVLDVSGSLATDGERGLLGMAFDPNYATNHRVYFGYVDSGSKALRVIRTNGFDLSTAQTIVDVPHPTDANNHYGGTIRFGGDGNLYVGMGDGGGGNDPENDAQNLDNWLGKILRLDVSGNGPGYVAPSDNPFSGSDTRRAIWAYGLRNPYKFSFDTNGDLYIGDVGQDTREEIDRAAGNAAGNNYGWRTREGSGGNPATDGTIPPGAIDPIFDYDHSIGRTVIGGVVYHGSALGASANGRYFFGDYITQKLWSIDPNAADVRGSLIDYTATLGISPDLVSIDAGMDGEIYLTNLSGSVYRLEPVPEPTTSLVLFAGTAAFFRRRKTGTRRC